MTMTATRPTLRQALWQSGIVRAVLLRGALAGMTLGSTAHAQIAFRSASSAFIAGGGGTPVAPTLRSSSWAQILPGKARFYIDPAVADYDPPTLKTSWPEGGNTCCAT